MSQIAINPISNNSYVNKNDPVITQPKVNSDPLISPLQTTTVTPNSLQPVGSFSSAFGLINSASSVPTSVDFVLPTTNTTQSAIPPTTPPEQPFTISGSIFQLWDKLTKSVSAEVTDLKTAVVNSSVGQSAIGAYNYVEGKAENALHEGAAILRQTTSYVRNEATEIGKDIKSFLGGKKTIEFGSAAYNQVLGATQGIRDFFAGNATSAAENRMKVQHGKVGKCMGGVNDSLEVAFNLHLNCPSAYQAADTLRHNPSFLEIKPMPGKIEDLPVGAIVVLGAKGKHKEGHIFTIVAGANGTKLEACDYISKGTPSYEKYQSYGSFSAFIPMEPPESGVANPPRRK
ncbi:MAG: hypothetical protein H7263_14385 [Candidatus Sericytochromatia bacterium]|nr:hypothetical protein [Candidatus Sericytochromatia bacterium]